MSLTPRASDIVAPTSPAASEVAEGSVAALLESEGVLSPTIGRLGVQALCRRSLHLAAVAHPWLLQAKSNDPSRMDFDVLRRVLAAQSPAAAEAGGQALLQNFWDLLNSLIGASLVDRLLDAEPPHEPNP